MRANGKHNSSTWDQSKTKQKESGKSTTKLKKLIKTK